MRGDTPEEFLCSETFEKCSILVKVKPPAQRGLRPGGKGENFNHRYILSISRIEI